MSDKKNHDEMPDNDNAPASARVLCPEEIAFVDALARLLVADLRRNPPK